MKFEVMSRNKAHDMSYSHNIEDCVIISITDVCSLYNSFAPNPHIRDVLHLKFDDVEKNDVMAISESDAEKIIEFVNRHLPFVDKIIVHCEAGVSRSAGVCAALMQIINGDDSPIFNSGRYCPNMTCYRAIMEAYYGTYDKEAADAKLAQNIQVWRKENGLDER